MKSLSTALITEKNKLNTNNAWLVFLWVTLNNASGTTFTFVRNTENIAFSGVTYSAVPFELDLTKIQTEGEIPSVDLRIANSDRVLQSYLDELNGAIGSGVTITVVNSGHLADNYAELEIKYDVIGCTSNAEWVMWSLGAPNPLRQRFPKYRYITDHCDWIFKGAECGYTGAETTCDKSLKACQAYSNSVRFSGKTGLRPGGFRIV